MPEKAAGKVKVSLELLVDEDVLQQAIDENAPGVPVSTHEEKVWLEEALDQVLQSGKFSIQTANVEGQVISIKSGTDEQI